MCRASSCSCIASQSQPLVWQCRTMFYPCRSHSLPVSDTGVTLFTRLYGSSQGFTCRARSPRQLDFLVHTAPSYVQFCMSSSLYTYRPRWTANSFWDRFFKLILRSPDFVESLYVYRAVAEKLAAVLPTQILALATSLNVFENLSKLTGSRIHLDFFSKLERI